MAKNRKYKTKSFTEGRNKNYALKLEELCNQMSEEGWRLHSWNPPGILGEACIAVFYIDVPTQEEKEKEKEKENSSESNDGKEDENKDK